MVFALVVLGPATIDRELLPPDEPRFTLVSREMVTATDPIVLTRGGELYTDKPPLLFWLQATLFALAGGFSETTARLPLLAASVLLAGVLHRTTLRWYGEPLATTSVVALFSMSLVIQRGAWVATDALLAVTTWSAISIAARLRDAPSRRGEALLGLVTGLAFLAKGPVVAVFLVLAALASPLARADVISLRTVLRPLSLGVAALVTVPWLVLWIGRVGVDTALGALWQQNAVRFIDSWDNIEPWWYFGKSLLLDTFPWSLAWIALFFRKPRERLWGDRHARFLIVLSALAVVFFSIPAGKRGVYLLPLYPAFAILGALALDAVRTVRIARLVFGGACLGIAALTGAGAIAAWALGAPPLPRALTDEPLVRLGAATLLGLVAVTVSLWGMLVARESRRAFAAPAILALGAGLLAWPVFTPALNQAQRARAFAEDVRHVLPADAVVGYSRTKWELMAWYLDIPGVRLDTPTDVARHLAGEGTRVVVGHAERIGGPEVWPEGSHVRLTTRLGRSQIAVVVRDARERDGARLSSSP